MTTRMLSVMNVLGIRYGYGETERASEQCDGPMSQRYRNRRVCASGSCHDDPGVIPCRTHSRQATSPRHIKPTADHAGHYPRGRLLSCLLWLEVTLVDSRAPNVCAHRVGTALLLLTLFQTLVHNIYPLPYLHQRAG